MSKYEQDQYSKDDFLKYELAESQYNEETEKMTDRLDKVVNLVFNFFGKKVGYWYFEDAAEEKCGTPRVYGEGDNRVIESLVFDPHPSGVCTIFWDYSQGIPLNFLFMNDDEIVDFLKDEKKREEEEKALKVEKKKNAKERKLEEEREREELIRSLTPEQRKLLGVKVNKKK